MLDATSSSAAPLTADRLFGWDAALFPTEYSGLSPIAVGRWRDDATGPMQVVSGPVSRSVVHLEGPPAYRLPAGAPRILATTGEPARLWADLAHLFFVTLHPFDDGDGRIVRAVGEQPFLARVDSSDQRFHSLY